jgi:hypothetical protein
MRRRPRRHGISQFWPILSADRSPRCRVSSWWAALPGLRVAETEVD